MRKLFLAPVAIIGFSVFIVVGGFIVQHLWNWLMPELFRLPLITIWQSLGLLALCRILFGGFRMGGPRHHMGGPWTFRAKGRWGRMSDEERAEFRRKVRARFGDEVFNDVSGPGDGGNRL